MSSPLLVLDKLTFHRDGNALLKGVDLEIQQGEKLVVWGDNGVGKSSLLKLIVGLHNADAGDIRLTGKSCKTAHDFRELRKRVGLVFQDSDDQLFCPTVLDDVMFGPLNLGWSHETAKVKSLAMLTRLGVLALADRATFKLSGGQKRLVALASVLVMEPDLLLLDEPTNGLDQKARHRLIEVLQNLPQALLLVTHDTQLIQQLDARVIALEDGQLKPAVVHAHQHVHLHVHTQSQGAESDHSHAELSG